MKEHVTWRLSALIALAGLMVLGGCGYRLKGKGNFLPEHIRTIALPPFDTHVPRSELVEELTRAVTTEFIERGGFRIQPGTRGADATLIGTVVGLAETPIAFDDEGRATRSLLTITTSVKMRDLREDVILYENPAFVFRRELEIEPDATDIFDPESEAIQEIADEFARTLVATLVEGF